MSLNIMHKCTMFHFKNFSNLKTLTWKHFGIFFFLNHLFYFYRCFTNVDTEFYNAVLFCAVMQPCNVTFSCILPNMFMPWYLLICSFKNGFKRHIKMTDTMLTTLWLKIIMLWNVLRKPCKYSYLKTKLQRNWVKFYTGLCILFATRCTENFILI